MLIHDILDFKSEVDSTRQALSFQERALSYGQLRARTNRLANGLLALARRGDRIAILSYNSVEYVEAYYGIPRAGMAMVVVNYRLAPAEMVELLSSVMPVAIIVEPEFSEIARHISGQVKSIRHILVTGSDGDGSYERLLAQSGAAPPNLAISPEETAWLLFTSGTTGLPKAAMLSHRNIISGVINSSLCWGSAPDTTLMLPWPMYHVAGYALLVMHLHGNAVHLLRRFDRMEFLEQIERRRITDITLAPTMISMLMEADARDIDLSSVERVYYGSAPMPLKTLRAAMQRLPGARFRSGYGMTEAAGLVMYLSDADHEMAARTGDLRLGSVGRPMPMTSIRVVGPDGQDLPPGEVGEILVKGDQVVAAIWDGAHAAPRPVSGGWFATGDLGRWEERGYLYIVDRSKDMIISGGENIYSSEVENIIYQLPNVAQVAVFGVPDEVWGENVVAVIRMQPDTTLNEEAVIEHCRAHLASYKKPRRVIFLDEMPLNPSGKILKRVLREWVANPEIPLPKAAQQNGWKT